MQRKLPPEIRKACMLLGVRTDDLTVDSVLTAWKKQIAAPGVHPEQGGDNEAAIYLNTAKDTLIRWLEGDPGGNEPDNDDPRYPTGKPRKPKPECSGNHVMFPNQEQ